MNHSHMTSTTSTFAVVLGSLAILASNLGAVTTAQAAEPPRKERARFDDDQPRKTVVRFGDLNLGAAEGRQVLHSRLKRAARNVCSTNSTPFVQARQWERECEAATLRVALAEVGPVIMLAAQ